MSKPAIFTLQLETHLRDQFVAAAAAAERPAEQVLRELMRDFVQGQRQLPEYAQFVAAKVSAARASVRAVRGRSNADVEGEFASRRARVVGPA